MSVKFSREANNEIILKSRFTIKNPHETLPTVKHTRITRMKQDFSSILLTEGETICCDSLAVYVIFR